MTEELNPSDDIVEESEVSNEGLDSEKSTEDSAENSGENAADGTQGSKNLDEEGDIAADYLEELLDIFDLDGDINIDVRQGRAYLEVTTNEDSNLRLISEPDTVEALQELTRLAVQAKTTNFSRLILDIGGSRQAKIEAITRTVNRIIEKVKGSGVAAPMKPMSSYERKIAHDIISEAGLVSESEGEGKDRHIVVKPA
jgi:spoIIIJ-associated protein